MTNAVNIAQSGSNNQTFRNRIINGAQVIDQRNAGAAVTGINAAGFYITDRWKSMAVNTWGGSGVVFSGQQNRDSLTPPAGFTNYLGMATTTQSTSLPATTTLDLTQVIEGFNMADFAWGTANAQPVTLSFWVRSNLTGTFGGSVTKSAYNRSYVFSYTISAANTWEYKTVTIPGETTGTWLTTNGLGANISFSLGAGSSMMTTPGSWNSTLFSAPTGQQQICASTSNRFYITGVQLEEGTAASPFENRLYGTELQLCQRYYEKSYNIETPPGTNVSSSGEGMLVTSGSTNQGGNLQVFISFKVFKRAVPTVTGFADSGTSGQWTYANSSTNGTNATANFGATGQHGTRFFIGTGQNWAVANCAGCWTASAEL
jgi:hypothetical protein